METFGRVAQPPVVRTRESLQRFPYLSEFSRNCDPIRNAFAAHQTASPGFPTGPFRIAETRAPLAFRGHEERSSSPAGIRPARMRHGDTDATPGRLLSPDGCRSAVVAISAGVAVRARGAVA